MSAFKAGDVVEVDVGTRAAPRWVRALVVRPIEPRGSREREWYAVAKLGADVAFPASAMRVVEPAPDGPYVFDASKLSREERESLLASVATLPGVHLEYARAADEGACADVVRRVVAWWYHGGNDESLQEMAALIKRAEAALAATSVAPDEGACAVALRALLTWANPDGLEIAPEIAQATAALAAAPVTPSEGACAAAIRQMLFQLDQGTLAPALHERDSCIAQARAAYAGAKAPYSWAGLDDATLLIVRDALSERARDLNRLMRDGDDVTREDWRGPRDAVEAVERAANDALSARS